jgi:hypothetical protein
MFVYRYTRTVTTTLLLMGGLLSTSSATAQNNGSNLRRLSAEFQNSTSLGGSGEVFTTAAALPGGAGGTVVYQKSLTLPNDVDVLYITFSGQGDVHNGSVLLMNAAVNGSLIEPLAGQTAGGGGGPHIQTGWYTLIHLPAAPGVANCNDGGGGTADCHDNTIYFSGCFRIGHHDPTDPFTVRINLANLPGGDANFSFYERATIYIDGQKDEQGDQCKGVSTAAH